MTLAGHLPTQRFSADDVAAMPVCLPGNIASEGYSRATDDRGRMIVICWPPGEDLCMVHAVRPIIRVRAPSRKIAA